MLSKLTQQLQGTAHHGGAHAALRSHEEFADGCVAVVTPASAAAYVAGVQQQAAAEGDEGAACDTAGGGRGIRCMLGAGVVQGHPTETPRGCVCHYCGWAPPVEHPPLYFMHSESTDGTLCSSGELLCRPSCYARYIMECAGGHVSRRNALSHIMMRYLAAWGVVGKISAGLPRCMLAQYNGVDGSGMTHAEWHAAAGQPWGSNVHLVQDVPWSVVATTLQVPHGNAQQLLQALGTPSASQSHSESGWRVWVRQQSAQLLPRDSGSAGGGTPAASSPAPVPAAFMQLHAAFAASKRAAAPSARTTAAAELQAQ